MFEFLSEGKWKIYLLLLIIAFTIYLYTCPDVKKVSFATENLVTHIN